MSSETTTREVLACLLAREGPLCPSELANRVDRTPRSVRYALRQLEEDGVVDWHTDPTDTRYRRYRLSREAEEALTASCSPAGDLDEG